MMGRNRQTISDLFVDELWQQQLLDAWADDLDRWAAEYQQAEQDQEVPDEPSV